MGSAVGAVGRDTRRNAEVGQGVGRLAIVSSVGRVRDYRALSARAADDGAEQDKQEHERQTRQPDANALQSLALPRSTMETSLCFASFDCKPALTTAFTPAKD